MAQGIYPVFKPKLQGTQVTTLGEVLVADLDDLEQIAEENELTPMSAFMDNREVPDDFDGTPEELDEAIRSGIYGSFYMMQACLPAMKTHGGRIVNFGSGAGTMGMATRMSYNIAKEAIRVITRTAAREWGPLGIQVNTVNPFLRTDAWENWEKARPEDVKKYAESVPLKRLGDPVRDGGPLMVFIASDANSYMTGHDFNLDGGWEIHA